MSTKRHKAELIAGYAGIPAKEAQRIAETYQKNAVVILAADREKGLVDCATFGKAAQDKVGAVKWAEALLKVSGVVGGPIKQWEDFQATPAAVSKERIDILEREVARLKKFETVVNLMASSKHDPVRKLGLRYLAAAESLEDFQEFLQKHDAAEGKHVCRGTNERPCLYCALNDPLES